MKNNKLKLEKFRVTKLNNPSLINGGDAGKDDGGGQGETILGDVIKPKPTRPTRKN